MNRQPQLNEDKDTCKEISFIPTGATVTVQRGDGRPWMHGTVAGHGTEVHNGRSFEIRVMKTKCTITRMKRHMKAISAEDYLRNEMSKADQPQTYVKFKKLVDHFAKLHKHKDSNVMETHRKGMMVDTCTMQLLRHTNWEHRNNQAREQYMGIQQTNI